MADMTLGGIIIPPGSEMALNYIGARWDRYNDWSHVGSMPQGEWFSLPQGERNTMISRLRWLMRNNEYCAALHTTFQTHIGHSTLRSKARDNPEYNDAKERFWLTFSDSCEVSGLSLAEVEDIIATELLCAGELFVLKLKTGQVQLIPAEWVFSDADGPENEIQGIVYDGKGLPTHYRIGERDHRGQLKAGKTLVPAAQVLHVYRRERIEQLRGVPWLAAAIKPLRDIDEITTAKVASVKNQSFLSLAITREAGSTPFPNLADTGNTNGATTATGKPSQYSTLRNGTIMHLDKGDTIQALSTQFQSADFGEFLLGRLRAVGATIGLPLELFIEGYKDSSYSSARATNVIWARKVRSIREMIERRFLQPLQLWASERARATKQLKGARELDKESAFGWPAVPEIDAIKETEGRIKKLAAGLTTYSAVFAEANLFFDDEIKVRARDAKLMLEAATAEGINPKLLVPDLDFGGGQVSAPPAAPVPAPDAPPAEPAPTPEANKIEPYKEAA